MTDKDETRREAAAETIGNDAPETARAGEEDAAAAAAAETGAPRQPGIATKSGRPRGRLYDLLNNSDRF